MLEALAILFILAPLLPLLSGRHWSIRFFDFVRIQTSVLQILLLCILIVTWDPKGFYQWCLILALCLVLFYQLSLILPYTPFTRKNKPQHKLYPSKLHLITANVLQTNTAYDKFITLIKNENPDIFATMESNKSWDTQISKALTDYRFSVKVPLDNFYGMHVYSKIPFEESEVKFLIEEDVPSVHCKLQFANQFFNLIIVHPAPPSPSENETSKERDAELMRIGNICRAHQEPTVVCGDLNDVVWSKTSKLFKKMTGYNDPRIGRGLYPSFHAQYWLLRFPLDHLFYSSELYVTEMRRLKPFGSDHFAMLYKIAFPLCDISTSNPTLSKENKKKVESIIDDGKKAAQD